MATDAVGAIRLAMEAGADGRARLRVIRAILDLMPASEPGDTASVRLFLDAVRASKCELRVTDHEPHGRLSRRQSKPQATRGR